MPEPKNKKTKEESKPKPKTLSKDLQASDVLREPMQMAEVFSESGMFPDIKTQAEAVVKILAGKEMGLTPFESMNALYIVNGKLALVSNVMARIVKKSNKYDYKIDKLDNEECTISFFTINGEKELLGKSTFTRKDAAAAGIINKDVWKNYPRNMLFARALSNGVRWFCPDSACGYSVEELNDLGPVQPEKKQISMDASGKVESEPIIDVTPETPTEEPKQEKKESEGANAN